MSKQPADIEALGPELQRYFDAAGRAPGMRADRRAEVRRRVMAVVDYDLRAEAGTEAQLVGARSVLGDQPGKRRWSWRRPIPWFPTQVRSSAWLQAAVVLVLLLGTSGALALGMVRLWNFVFQSDSAIHKKSLKESHKNNQKNMEKTINQDKACESSAYLARAKQAPEAVPDPGSGPVPRSMAPGSPAAAVGPAMASADDPLRTPAASRLAASSAPTPCPRQDRMLAEILALRDRGEPRQTLAYLRRWRSCLQAGSNADQIEGVRIMCLVDLGRISEASLGLARMKKAYPSSPHVRVVEHALSVASSPSRTTGGTSSEETP